MKKRNYLEKAMAVVAMLLVGLSFTSCDENDNAVIINGKEWVKAEVIKTDDGAKIVANTPSDVNRMLMKIASDINDATQAGEDYVITIETPSLEASESDNTISIPLYDYLTADPTSEAKVVINFANAVNTSDEPLKIQAKGATGGAALTSENKVEINLPSTSSGYDLELFMPKSTVTLNAGTIDELVATTAINTLIIESGVTVNWLKVKDGRVLVKEGGKVLGYLRNGDERDGSDSDAYVNENGVEPLFTYGPDVYYMKDDAQEAYFTQNLKIVKGKAAYARVEVSNALAKDALESIIIDDGAAASLSIFSGYWDNDKNMWVDAPAKGVKLVKGLGNKTAKIYSRYVNEWTDGEGNKNYRTSTEGFQYVNELNNLTVDITTNPDAWKWDDTQNQWVSVGSIKCIEGQIYLGPNSTDCDFISPEDIYGQVKNNVMSKVTNCKLSCVLDEDIWSYISSVQAINSSLAAKRIYDLAPNSENSTFSGNSIGFTNQYVSGNTATVKGCKFEKFGKQPRAEINLPYQTADRSSFNFTFESCQFGEDFKFNTDYVGSKPWLDKDGKRVTEGYKWYELDENGDPKTDEETGWTLPRKYSTKLEDVPQANQDNGEGYWNGYNHEVNDNGLWLNAYYNDYKGYLTLNNCTLGGKAIDSKTDMIGNVNQGRDEKGKQATKTYYVIGGKTYEVVFVENQNKYRLIEAEE